MTAPAAMMMWDWIDCLLLPFWKQLDEAKEGPEEGADPKKDAEFLQHVKNVSRVPLDEPGRASMQQLITHPHIGTAVKGAVGKHNQRVGLRHRVTPEHAWGTLLVGVPSRKTPRGEEASEKMGIAPLARKFVDDVEGRGTRIKMQTRIDPKTGKPVLHPKTRAEIKEYARDPKTGETIKEPYRFVQGNLSLAKHFGGRVHKALERDLGSEAIRRGAQVKTIGEKEPEVRLGPGAGEFSARAAKVSPLASAIRRERQVLRTKEAETLKERLVKIPGAFKGQARHVAELHAKHLLANPEALRKLHGAEEPAGPPHHEVESSLKEKFPGEKTLSRGRISQIKSELLRRIREDVDLYEILMARSRNEISLIEFVAALYGMANTWFLTEEAARNLIEMLFDEDTSRTLG